MYRQTSDGHFAQGLHIFSIPDDLFGEVFSFLDFEFIVRRLPEVSRRFRKLVYSHLHAVHLAKRNVKHNTNIDDVVSFLRRFHSLQEVAIDGLTGVTTNHLRRILEGCGKSLTNLTISECDSLECVDLSACTILRSLTVASDKVTQIVFPNTPLSLESVNISNVDIDNNMCRHIMQYINPTRVKSIKFCGSKTLSQPLIRFVPWSADTAMPPVNDSSSKQLTATNTNTSTETVMSHSDTMAFRMIESLDLSYCFSLSNVIIEANELHELTLQRTFMNDAKINVLLQQVKDCNLQSLILAGSPLLSRPITFEIPTLTALDLSNTKVGDEAVEHIVRHYCRNLKNLNLFNCKQLANPKIISHSLEVLKLGFCSGLRAPYLMCPTLEHLSLRTTEINDEALEAILQNLEACREMSSGATPTAAPTHESNASGQSTTVTVTTVTTPNAKRSGLKALDLTQCVNLENPRFRCPSLVTLNLAQCENLEFPIFQNCLSLEELDLNSTNIKDEVIEHIIVQEPSTVDDTAAAASDAMHIDRDTSHARVGGSSTSQFACPNLRMVDLRWCNNITDPKLPLHIQICR